MAFNPLGKITAADSPSVDAFSRWRVSEPVTLFAAQNQYEFESLLFDGGATGTGSSPTHSANTRMVALAVAAGTGTSYVQTFDYIPYQPGRSQLIKVTGVLGAAVTDATVEVGIGDANNAVVYRQNATGGLEFVLRSSTSGAPVETIQAQADWTYDTFNGTGASGLTIDPTKTFILIIDAQFLAMGRVRCGFDLCGVIMWATEFDNANILAVPYMQTLSLPVRMRVAATATAAPKTAYFKCAEVESEGGFSDDLGYEFASASQTVAAGFSGGAPVDTHLLSVRPLTTYNGITNHSRFRLSSVDLLVTGSNPVRWKLCVGSTFSAGPTWSGAGVSTNSAFEQTTAPGTLSATGVVAASGFLSASASVKSSVSAQVGNRYPITLDAAGAVRANGTLSLVVASMTTSSSTTFAAFNWTEIR